MVEELSQDEIDALLASMGMGTAAANQEEADKDLIFTSMLPDMATPEAIKPAGDYPLYNFKQPIKFRSQGIYAFAQTFVKIISTFLTCSLRADVRTTLKNCEQVQYRQIIGNFAKEKWVCLRFELGGQTGMMLLEPGFCLGILQVLLGGKLTGPIIMQREFTEIEAQMLKQVFSGLFEHFFKKWPKLFAEFEQKPVFKVSEIASDWFESELSIIHLELKAALYNLNAKIVFFMPLDPLENVLGIKEKIGSGQKQVKKTLSLFHLQLLKEHLQEIKVPITVLLGETELSFINLLNLREGDVIRLNQPIIKPLDVLIGKRPRFGAKVMPTQFKRGFKIV